MIVLLGAPGSGKGTQSRLLAGRDGYKIFAVGEILRAEIASGTECGKILGAALQKGEFAPLDVVIRLLKQYVVDKNYVLDGFPRNMAQVDELETFIAEHGQLAGNVTVVDFIVPIDILKDRLEHRRLCKVCDGALLQDAKECTFCGHYSEDAYIRDDDSNAQAVARRLEIFHQEKDALVEYYSKQGIYHAIDATLPVEEVYAKLKEAVAS